MRLSILLVGEKSINHFILYNKVLYTIAWLLCAFSLVVDRDILEDTHTDGVRSRQLTSADLFFFFHAPKIFQPFEFLLYKTNRLNFAVCVYYNRSQKSSQRVKNSSHVTRLRLVSYLFVLYTLRRHLWSEKRNLFVNYYMARVTSGGITQYDWSIGLLP